MDRIWLEMMAAGCTNSCRHCKDSGRLPYGELLSLDDIEWAVGEFRKVSGEVGICNLWHEQTAHPDFLSIVDYWQQNSGDPEMSWEVLATNGYGIARSQAPHTLLRGMKALGIQGLSFTLHGLEERHDWFTCRNGAFQDIWTAARSAAREGMGVHFNIYIDKENIHDVDPLLRSFDVFRGEISKEMILSVNVPGYIANHRLRRFDRNLRPRLIDLEPIEKLLGDFWRLPIREHTEGRWIERILSNPEDVSLGLDGPEYKGRDSVILAIDSKFDVYERAYNYNREPVKHGNLKQDAVHDLWERIQEWRPPTYPDIVVLANQFGEPMCDLIHSSGGSLQHKWIDMYLSSKIVDPPVL